jgi:outer membrane protein OmpA-like peptidoglycan-associated protein
MRKNIVRGLSTTLFLFAFFSVASAQDRPAPSLWFGVNGGYGLASHSVNGLSCESGCPNYNGGTGGGAFFGASLDYLFGEHWGIAVRGDYMFSSLNMQATTSDQQVRGISGNLVPLVRNYTLAVNDPAITADLSLFYKIDRFQFHFGPAIAITSNQTWSSSANIVSPGNVTYGNQLRDTTFFPSQSIAGAQSLQMFLMPGVGYEIPLSTQWMLRPDISVDIPLTSLNSIYTWKETIFKFGASIEYGFASEPAPPPPAYTPPPPPPTPVPQPTPAPRPLVAKLTANAVDANGNREPKTGIRVQVQFVSEAFPVLPFIFFDKNSSTIPPRYVLLKDPAGFSSDAIGTSPDTLHLNVLNIIGERLKDHPRATITVHGYADPATESADCDLAQARAATVRAYLANVWGIDSGRVILKTTGKKNCAPNFATVTKSENGYAENRRAVIESSDPTMLAPVPRHRFSEPVSVNPPAIEFDPSGTSAEGIRSWRLDAEQDGRQLFADSGMGMPQTIIHPVDKEQAGKLQADKGLVLSLAVTDTGGHTAVASDTVPVAIDILNKEVERLTLTLFETSSDKLSNSDSSAIRKFLSDFSYSDSVSIVGFTDSLVAMTGDSLYNKKLSTHRAQNVMALVHAIAPKADKMYSEGAASSRFPAGIFSYDTPEERFLSRTVQIELKKDLEK